MNNLKNLFCAAIAGLLVCNLALAAEEQPAAPAAQIEAPEAPAQVEAPDVEAPGDDTDFEFPHHSDQHNVILHFNQDSNLPAGSSADAVISISGSSTSAGEVQDAVVSIFGNTKVTGPVGDTALAVFGNTYVNSRIGGDVVAVFGNVELGPQARVAGDVAVVGGRLTQDEAARVRGNIEQVELPLGLSDFEWLRPWVKHCLLYGRPLAIEPGLGWAWSLALGFLTLYVVLALLFSSSVQKCVQTLETSPGHSLLTSLLVVLATPVLSTLLAVTVVGIALVPFVWIALFLMGLFGTAVILATIGRRVTAFIGSGPLSDTAFSVLVGGAIVLAIYTVPVLGFIAYKFIGILGLGVVIYTLILAAKAKRESQFAAAAQAAPIAPVAAAAPAAAADPAPGAAEAAAETPASPGSPGSPGSPAAPAAAPTTDITALPRAGFWIRMMALLIDVIVIGIAFSVLHADDIFLPALAAYGAIMWKLKGTTIGGILCNLQVVRLDGRELDWGTAVVRALSCFLSLIFVGLGFLWIVFDDGRQSWHDKIAGTAVVRLRQGASLL